LLTTLVVVPQAFGQISDQLANPADEGQTSVIDQTTPARTLNAYPEGDFSQQLQAAGGAGTPEGCVNDSWGCGGSPYRNGPGRCDNYRTGPIWRVSIDGVFLHREDTDLTEFATALGTTLDAVDQYENFEYGGGARILAFGNWPQLRGYELAIGYVGVEEWNSSIVLPIEAIPPVVGPPALVGVNERETLTYNSSLHSLEFNWQRLTDSNWKPYAGVRYVLFDEDVHNIATQYVSTPLAVGETSITTQVRDMIEVENNLIGFQVGARRDLWQVSRKVYLQTYANGGVYCNLVNRADVDDAVTTSTEILDDNPATATVDETGQTRTITTRTGNTVKVESTEAAFIGEASASIVWKLNRCCALRGGYEAMYLHGVHMGDDAFMGRDERETTLIHGIFAGLEYRR
jgi:hypothetical protein